MSSFVSDANVIFSGLISGGRPYIDLVTKHQLFLPDFGLTELQQYQEIIREKTKQTPDELKTYTLALFGKITVVPNLLISLIAYRSAFELCKNVDPKDMTYIALSIEFNIPLITRDKPLAHGLRQQGFINVVMLDELLSQPDEFYPTN